MAHSFGDLATVVAPVGWGRKNLMAAGAVVRGFIRADGKEAVTGRTSPGTCFLYFLTLPQPPPNHATSWRPNVQQMNPVRDISSLNHARS